MQVTYNRVTYKVTSDWKALDDFDPWMTLLAVLMNRLMSNVISFTLITRLMSKEIRSTQLFLRKMMRIKEMGGGRRGDEVRNGKVSQIYNAC